ncbi:triphosphoribosyl-dephospho-CoA synthase [Paenibacillus xylanexedens]
MVQWTVQSTFQVPQLVSSKRNTPGSMWQDLKPMKLALASSAAQRCGVLLGELAVQALIDEAELTPKPGLVDLRDNGAHTDLNVELMRRSARALRPAFTAMGEAGWAQAADQSLRERLAAIGRDGEASMLAATGGTNTHRGAVWALGLLTGAAAVSGPGHGAAEIAAVAGALARLPDRHAPQQRASNGQRVQRRYGARGAREEAEAGFPHVVDIGLPALRAARSAGRTETQARLDALLAIMASLEDTCLLHRGGHDALAAARSGAATVLSRGGSGTAEGMAALEQLGSRLVGIGASPGGSADLLAAVLFLDRIDQSASTELGACPLATSQL